MQESDIPFVACVGKHRFDDRLAAIKAVKNHSAKHKTDLNAYRCPFCDGFHIGKQSYSFAKRKRSVR